MTNLISIDPGVHHAGLAYWHGQDLVCACRVEDRTGGTAYPLLDVIYRRIASQSRQPLQDVVIEMPRTYEGRATRGDAKDLLALARVVGELRCGLTYMFSIGPATLYEPNQWKGQTTKEVTENRCKAILRKEELDHVQLPGDKRERTEVWDAIGIGLFHLGRKS